MSAAKTRSSVPYRKSGPLVVVALAENHLCRDYATHLVENGFVAPTASTATEAVGLATRLSPEMVILDLDAPGVTAAGLIRREPLTRHIGLVAVSPTTIAGQIGLPARGLFDVIIEAPCSATTLLTELLAMLVRFVPNEI